MSLSLASKNKFSPKLSKKKSLKKNIDEIKDKLSGKNYSPIIANAKSKKVTKKAITLSTRRPKNIAKKDKLINSNKATIPEKETNEIIIKEKEEPNGNIPLRRKINVINEGPSQAKKEKTGPQINAIFSKVKLESPVIKTTKKKNISTKKSVPSKDSSERKVTMSDTSGSIKECGKTVQKLKKTLKLRPLKKRSTDGILPDKISSINRENDFEKDGKKEEEISSKKGPLLRKSTESLKAISDIKTLKKNPSQKSRVNKRRQNDERGVCVFKNIPHGFYEKQIKQYCSQFGKVTGVYHPVSKNGNSKGYAFVQFAHKDVAQVVAETMNNYVMFYKRMRCELVPKEKEKSWVFRRSKTNEDVAREQREAGLKQRMRHRSKEEVATWVKRKQGRIDALHRKLASLGVDYQFQT